MVGITAVMNTESLGKLLDGGAGKRVRGGASLAVRDSLAMIEGQHKKKEIRRASSSGGRAVANKWTTRSGIGRRSFHRDWKKGSLEGAYGSDLRRMKKLEDGGVIKPKGKYLAIPTKNAPKDVWPRYVPNLIFIQSLKGQPLLVKQTGKDGGFVVMYILRRQVVLPPRPTLKRAVKATEKKIDKRLLLGAEKGIWGE